MLLIEKHYFCYIGKDKMAAMIFNCCVLLISITLINGQANTTLNTTSPKDMYVVRATVYQVGILTKRKNNSIRFAPGHQESITFYHKNGSNLDMGAIPRPLQTNVTAENMVGVVPINGTSQSLPWSALKDFTLPLGSTHPTETSKIAKREIAKIEKGAALIPKETGVQSIALPPLLALNNNLSKIPVPIPNVSVVSYAKVNTLIHNP